MSSLKLLHSGGNGVIISAPSSNPAANRTITLNDNYAGDGSFVTANSSGNVGIGTASPDHKLQIDDSAFTQLYLKGTGNVAGVRFGNTSYTNGHIYYDNGANMNFHTNGSERMRISTSYDSQGGLHMGVTGNATTTGAIIGDFGGGNTYMQLAHSNTGSTHKYHNFIFNSSAIGSIAQNSAGNAVSFNTSSDYRLKENEVLISDGITRLKTLKPYRFNFKNDSSTKVDGFFAHEVTAVPEAITGTKDETEDILYTEEDTIPSGKKVGDVKETVPIYQGIDQSKLVPLLTAALQEAVAKIETLETKVAALEGA